MAAAPVGKMKRKDMEDVYNEFSDFSLSAPPTKIRRLDAELPPIVEEEEPPAAAVPLVFDQRTTTTPTIDMSMNGVEESMVPLLHQEGEERALVLYKPVNNNINQRLILSPTASSNVLPYIVSSDIISGIKNQCFWRGNLARTEEKSLVDDDEQVAVNNCLAVIPWQTPVNAYTGPVTVSSDGPSEDMMDAEGASMEIEENIVGEATSTGIGGDGGFHQRPQHCMIQQQLPTNPSTPIMWSWG